MSSGDTPQGIVAIMTGPDGYEVANATSFDKSSAAGFSNKETQKRIVRTHLANAVIDALCHLDIGKAVDEYQKQRIVDTLTTSCGYKTHYVEIGYD